MKKIIFVAVIFISILSIAGVSFADQYADEVFSTAFTTGNVTPNNQIASKILGPNDGNYVSLGEGGSIVVKFTDNSLTGSGTSAADLWIYEVGGNVEATFVAISKNGTAWLDLGRIGEERAVSM